MMIEGETERFIRGEGHWSSGQSSGSRFIMLEANEGEIRAKNHVKNVNLDGFVGLEASTMMISARKMIALDGRKLTGSSTKKEGVVADGAFGVRKRDVRVKDKGSVVGDLLGCVGKDGSLGQENFKVVSLKPNLDKSKHMTFQAIEGSNVVLEDSLQRRKPSDGKMGYIEQPIMELSTAMEKIVGNLNQAVEQSIVETSSSTVVEGLHSQVMHMRISNGQSSSRFLYSAMYASPHRPTRCLL
ncbi:hypothetical protein GOBAR_DD09733 [Gossypium barbadense]|nr:hypothetical protein GOBAR_DD09733 [Gossypium barbadense]